MELLCPSSALIRQNHQFVVSIVEHLKRFQFNENIQWVHCDFHKGNLLFRGDLLVGVLDFDNVEYTCRTVDIAFAAQEASLTRSKFDRAKLERFLDEYSAIAHLTKTERQMIYPLMMRRHAIMLWWFYERMTKTHKLRAGLIKWTIDSMKALEREI